VRPDIPASSSTDVWATETMEPCHCGSAKPGADCCLPLLTGTCHSPTPEALMRSRYSAFCTGNVDYLLDTHLCAEPAELMRERISATLATTQWLGLQILHSQTSGDSGEVEFIARYKDAKGFGQLRERSTFQRSDGHWFYVSGRHLPPPKLQRNEPCWCGSGKKLKHCCGA
jgi:SEC-C motif-containing protein